MSLVNTPGASNADSYFSLAEADGYFAVRGVTMWAGSNDAKEQAARRATSYLDNFYRTKWIGIRAAETQSLAWPRVDGERWRNGGATGPLYDGDGFPIAVDGIPQAVKHAAMEAALLVLTGVDLEPALTRGGEIKSESKQVGPLSKSIEYRDGAPVVSRYTSVDRWLQGYITGTPGGSAGNVPIVRR